MTEVILATEDEISEAVGLSVLGEAGLVASLCLRRNGFGYLKSKIGNFIEMARMSPVLLITDLDQKPCPVSLMREWLGGRQAPDRFLFRVAVREIEAWLLADHNAMHEGLGMPIQRLPERPDELNDPKTFLLDLAKRAPRAIRDDLCVATGSVASQGIGYNARLAQWVSESWSPERAALRSPSLARTRMRVRALWADI